jgi:hypothetical protein
LLLLAELAAVAGTAAVVVLVVIGNLLHNH